MKFLTTTTLLLLLISGCSSLPSYYEMSCKDLLEKEKSLQSDYKFNKVGSVLATIGDIAENTKESTADMAASDAELNATKRDLREVQSAIHQKKCK